MPLYRVRFLKTVSNDTGHGAQACHRSVDVEAAGATESTQRARELAESQGSSRWTLSCCEIEVVELMRPHTLVSPGPA
jgi:hypothetical protein